MDVKSQRSNGRDGTLSSLSVAIEAINVAKEVSSITPAKAVFGSVSALLTMIRDSTLNKLEYVELGLACADVCRALDRGMNGRRLNELSRPTRDAISQLTTTVAEIQRNVIKRSGRNPVSRLFHAKCDAGVIAAWKLDLNRILHVFNTELAMNTHTIVVEMHQNMLRTREDTDNQGRAVSDTRALCITERTLTTTQFQRSMVGESPPPPPKAYFGRGELIEKIVGLAENLTPTALIGAGGIGKTSTALTVLHDDRIKQRFGDHRRFIRCDKFPASLPHFLHRLSMVTGAGVENPEDLTPLRPFLSSKDIFIVLDNLESVLDPRGMNAQEIYTVVEELIQFGNLCLCLTSRISIIPPACESLDVPTLSMEAALDTFYCIYKRSERSDQVSNILEQLDFHPLSVTLLATVAHHNKWGTGRLTKEWGKRRTGVLHTQHNQSLAATVELSLASPMFQELGPDARELLGVVAFFPQGVDENNLDWLFPTVSDRTSVFDIFCNLSLTYQSGEFITMLAPLRDYLYPKDPKSSQLLCATKERYFNRLSVDVIPGNPGPEEMRWIMSEDANIEHLLDVFTTIDANSGDIWNACAHFLEHLYWHKPQLVVLGQKVEGLPSGHPSKPRCLFELSRLFLSVGNHAESKQLLNQTLTLWRNRGDDVWVAETLIFLADAHCLLGLYREGVPQAKEALNIYERLSNTVGQARSLQRLARLLCGDNQLKAAMDAASRALDLSSDEENQCLVYQSHLLLGGICRAKGETENAINHFETALSIVPCVNWYGAQFRTHYSLAEIFFDEGRFGDAHVHIALCKSHAVNDAYSLGRAMELQGSVWYRQRRLGEAIAEVSCAAEVYEKLGAAPDLERCRDLLQSIRRETTSLIATNG